ncbi:MAG: iron ABC transporter permease [Rhodospirillales bacterium]|nr:iron ABC transporter permease [Rhodospirillales bacterium]
MAGLSPASSIPSSPGDGGAYARIVNAWRIDRSHWPLVILVLVLGFMVLYPIGAVVINSMLPDSTFAGMGMGVWAAAFSEPGMVEAITNTFKVVVMTQGTSLPIAIFIAWMLARTNIPFSRWIEFGFWVLFFLPSLGVTTGWLLLFDPDYGLVNKWLVGLGLFETSPFSLYSFGGIVFAHLTTYSIAVKVMLLTPAFRNLDGAIEEASRICGASALTTLVRVVIPIMVPAILVVGLMGIIHGLEAFEIELFLGTPFGFNVFSTKIYLLLAEEPAQYAKAGVMATSILLFMLPLIILQRWASTRRSYAVVTGRSSASLTELGRWRLPAFVVLMTIVLCMSLLPLGLLVTGSFMNLFGFFHLEKLWTLDHWRHALSDVTFVTGFWNMIKLGLGTALFAVFIYSIVAYCTVRLKSRWQAPLDILTWLPLAIPGIILGFGYLFMVLQVPVFRPLYGTMGVLILVGFLASMTLGVQMIKVHMLQLGAEVEEAGRVVGGSWVRTFRSIITPLTVPAMAVVGVLVFASAIRQVGSIILLSTGETRVLSILQLEFLTEGMLGPAAVIGAVIVLISLIAATIVRVISVRFGVQTRGG